MVAGVYFACARGPKELAMHHQAQFAVAVCRAAALSLLAVAGLPAQTQTATVRGVVTDRSGAVVPRTTVVLTNVDQNRYWRSTTNAEGEYVFVQIPPGNYS